MAVTISHLTNIGRAAHWSMSCDSGSSESIFQHTITESWGQKNEKKENTAQVQSRRDIIQSNRTYLWVGQGKWDRVDGWRMMQSYPRGILRGGKERKRQKYSQPGQKRFWDKWLNLSAFYMDRTMKAFEMTSRGRIINMWNTFVDKLLMVCVAAGTREANKKGPIAHWTSWQHDLESRVKLSFILASRNSSWRSIGQ